MADGNRFNPNSNAAGSKALGVKVEDRGPYRAERVVDLAPKVADQLGMKQTGVAPVVVTPIVVPQPDGTVKLGAGQRKSVRRNWPQQPKLRWRQPARSLLESNPH
jgi:rare lipoprotein A